MSKKEMPLCQFEGLKSEQCRIQNSFSTSMRFSTFQCKLNENPFLARTREASEENVRTVEQNGFSALSMMTVSLWSSHIKGMCILKHSRKSF